MNNSNFDIDQIIHELSDIPSSDRLVSFSENEAKQLKLDAFLEGVNSFEVIGAWKDIWKQAETFRLEADMQSMCLVSGIVSWEIFGKSLSTPLLITPIDWQYQRATNTIQIEAMEEATELNPYLKFVFKELNIQLSSDFDECNTVAEKLSFLVNFLSSHDRNWSFNDAFFVGNFHYHRFFLLRELQGIQSSEKLSSSFETLLGNSSKTRETYRFCDQNLVSIDSDQLKVFSALENDDVVVNGPPGTGKSQVLINILGKSLAGQYKTLVVSEKKVALEVLVKKLASYKLNSYAFVFHSQVKAKDFISKLKNTWKAVETMEYQPTSDLFLSKQYQDKIQMLLDKLNAPQFFSGVSYSEFRTLLAETPSNEDCFSSVAPDVSDWLSQKEVLVQLSDNLDGYAALVGCKHAFFTENNPEMLLKKLIELFNELQHTFDGFISFGAIDKLILKASQCQLIENEKYKAYSTLLGKPKAWNQFTRAVDSWKLLKTQLEEAQKEQQIWNKTPSKSQIDSWNNATKWLAKRSRRVSIRKMLADKSVETEIALANWNTYLALKQEELTLATYFNNLGLSSSEVELDLGLTYASQLSRESKSDLAELNAWSEDKRNAFINHVGELSRFKSELTRCFQLEKQTDISEFLQTKLKHLASLVANKALLIQVKEVYFQFIASCNTWKDIQVLVLSTNWRKIKALHPDLAKYEPSQLGELLDKQEKEEQKDGKLFAKKIHQQIRKTFNDYNELLREGTRKLSAEEKAFRQQLKTGKSILVKEFGKSKNYKSIRYLLESDARHWIQVIIPIWMATPVQVSNFFPLESEIFDLVLFDEASQIALPNALGSMHRAKRALVAGDSQQMSPTNFFGKNYSFSDLLNQAKYYFKNVDLKHHYRSESTELIRFSNEHFYNNELIVYPSPARQKPVYYNFIEHGVFENRRNKIEAMEIARLIETLSNEHKNSLGIVAFSEEQLNEIWKCCSPNTQTFLLNGIDENRIFFKALENVQGDEADVLIFGLGYAKNAEGDFHLHFGPLNLTNGYKRLNVLLTRAKREMHVFSSVKSNDFPFSENESVRLLKLLVFQLENGSFENYQHLQFPYGIQPTKVDSNVLTFRNIHASFSSSTELITFHKVLKNRGWNIKYTD